MLFPKLIKIIQGINDTEIPPIKQQKVRWKWMHFINFTVSKFIFWSIHSFVLSRISCAENLNSQQWEGGRGEWVRGEAEGAKVGHVLIISWAVHKC